MRRINFVGNSFPLQSAMHLFITWICLDQFRSIEIQRPRYRKACELGEGCIISEPSTEKIGTPVIRDNILAFRGVESKVMSVTEVSNPFVGHPDRP